MTPKFKTLSIITTLLAATIGGAAYAGEAVPAAPSAQKICLKDQITGSRVTKTVCRTVAEWQGQLSAEDFAILRKEARLAEPAVFASRSAN